MNVLPKFVPYVKPYRARFIQAGFAMGLVALFNGASILALKLIIDKVFAAKDFGLLWIAVIAVPGLVAMKTVASYVQNYLMSWIGQRVTQEIREDLFRHLHNLSLDFFAEQKSGEILARVTNDLGNVQSALQFLPLYLVRDTLTVIVLLGVLFSINWSFALLAVLSVPLASVMLVILGKKMRESSLNSQVIMGQIYHRFQESLQGMMLIKAFNYEEGAIDKFRQENLSFFNQIMRYLRATALSGPLMEFCGSLIAGALLYYGGREIAAGRMSSGGFIAFITSFVTAYAPIKNIARSQSELQRGLASGERIFQLLDEKPRVVDKPGAAPLSGIKKEILFSDLSFRYPGREAWALKGVTLRVRRGETVAIVGPSGSGKSTLIHLLLRLYDPQQGSISFDGVPLADLTTRSVREQIGLVTQETVLFNETVFENVAIGKKVVTLDEVVTACRIADADGFIEGLPRGYQTHLGDRGMRLSGGQRQRLAIARAVLKNPSLLVLDEATSNLDSTSESEVQKALERLMTGRTTIVIAHRLSTVQSADRIYVLNQGELAESGTHRELLAHRGLYRKLYDIQKTEPEDRPAAAQEA